VPIGMALHVMADMQGGRQPAPKVAPDPQRSAVGHALGPFDPRTCFVRHGRMRALALLTWQGGSRQLSPSLNLSLHIQSSAHTSSNK
jgi:hypothetical protein